MCVCLCVCVCVRERGVEILGSILTFQSNGLFIGRANSEGARRASRPAPTACC